MTLLLSLYGGLAIGLGGWIYLSLANKIFGAFLFSCGLLAVRYYKFNLFTGKTQYIFSNKYNLTEYILILIGNLIGVFLLSIFTTTLVKQPAIDVIMPKLTQAFPVLFIKGFGCGMLMSIATSQKVPIYLCPIFVTAFILAGFNHCIADAYYMFTAQIISPSWLVTLLGNLVGGCLINAKLLDN